MASLLREKIAYATDGPEQADAAPRLQAPCATIAADPFVKNSMAALQPFHIAIPVHDLDAARGFYGGVLGFIEKRSGRRWLEYDLMGHQLVAHLEPEMQSNAAGKRVDERHLPVPHFGVVLTMNQWLDMVERIRRADIPFAIGPTIRFEGEANEQATFFLFDPSGNALEFKAFADLNHLFGN
jgi:extradiol dioxygenase family protein